MKTRLMRDPEFAREYEALEAEYRLLVERKTGRLTADEAEDFYHAALALRRLAEHHESPKELLTTEEVITRLGFARKTGKE
ncbi:hypothetical protein Adeg_0811 [Ammonifex degensii KC4]|uniref:Uncharacterized protein n=1 Tax=Ammonifex degensii (strain DSM 10501 / KC4) TaxID=429009 RepID=C9RCG5_AMMDK|nr:hypothetical protein Adeg_0800 [Ammonifex degensii KC4]ACX51953.1 hypothetical protein Adeg_0811 [Ammonifex degensii KC4]